MTRGEANQPKIHFKGQHEDFIIFVDDAKAAEAWKTDKTIPLAHVVSSFKIFVTNRYVTALALVIPLSSLMPPTFSCREIT